MLFSGGWNRRKVTLLRQGTNGEQQSMRFLSSCSMKIQALYCYANRSGKFLRRNVSKGLSRIFRKKPSKLFWDSRTLQRVSDFAFLTLIYESAARASEIANLRFGDIRFDKKWAVVHLKGKGRKFRDIPVLPVPAKILKDYLTEESRYRQCDIDAPLFCNRSKASLTRGGVYYIIQKYVFLAQKEKPDLFPCGSILMYSDTAGRCIG